MDQQAVPSPQQSPQVYAPPPQVASPVAQHYAVPPQGSPAPVPGQVPQQQPYVIQAADGQQYYAPSPAPVPGAVPGTPYVVDPNNPHMQQQQPGLPPGHYTVAATVMMAQPGTVPPGVVEQPKPVIVKGHGLKSHLPQVTFCCFCFPLRHGAIALSAVMMIFNAICGLLLLVGSPLVGGYAPALSAVLMVVGVLYLVVAIFYCYGVVAITREDLMMVKRYVRGFIGCSIVWFLLEIASLAVQLAFWGQYSDYCYYGCGFNWAPWIVTVLIGVAIQVYFCSCLVSYERVLLANERAKAGIVTDDPKAIPLV
ncbi:hypothetical protein BGZ73_006254 [Actinomortierella ambigua]|nr:hypothetical protein BGZ73_006254 [Actinomortierella ambigua]